MLTMIGRCATRRFSQFPGVIETFRCRERILAARMIIVLIYAQAAIAENLLHRRRKPVVIHPIFWPAANARLSHLAARTSLRKCCEQVDRKRKNFVRYTPKEFSVHSLGNEDIESVCFWRQIFREKILLFEQPFRFPQRVN